MIQKFYPSATFDLKQIPGTSGCLEVIVNGKLVHSKKGGEGVPRDSRALLQKVQQAIEGGCGMGGRSRARFTFPPVVDEDVVLGERLDVVLRRAGAERAASGDAPARTRLVLEARVEVANVRGGAVALGARCE